MEQNNILYNVWVTWSVLTTKCTMFGVLDQFVTTITYYTLTLADFSAITFTDYHRLYIFTLRNSRRDLAPRSHLLRLLLKTATNWLVELLLKNWAKTANRFAYIARTSETKNGASQICCVRSPHLQRRCLGSESAAVWCHRGLLRRNRIPMLLRDVIVSARKSCLPVGYLATLCCVIQQWVAMSQYVPANLSKHRNRTSVGVMYIWNFRSKQSVTVPQTWI
jgi:hypothetical protein